MTYRRNHGSHFEKHKAAFEEGGGADDTTPEVEEEARADRSSDSRAESIQVDEKRMSDEKIA